MYPYTHISLLPARIHLDRRLVCEVYPANSGGVVVGTQVLACVSGVCLPVFYFLNDSTWLCTSPTTIHPFYVDIYVHICIRQLSLSFVFLPCMTCECHLCPFCLDAP